MEDTDDPTTGDSTETATTPDETPEDVVIQRVADAAPDETAAVTLELTQPMAKMIDMVKDGDETTAGWIKARARAALTEAGREFHSGVTGTVDAEIPPELYAWAQLAVEHRAATGEPIDDVEDLLMNYVDLEYEWTVEDGGKFDPEELRPGFSPISPGEGRSSAPDPHTSTREDRSAEPEAE